jgi:hypothetical protein
METVGTTILRLLRKTAIGYVETYGHHADPELSEFIEWVSRRLPPVTMAEELRAAIEMHRLMDPRPREEVVFYSGNTPELTRRGFTT